MSSFYFFCRPAFLVLQQAKLFYKKKQANVSKTPFFYAQQAALLAVRQK
jgi:hypothetical protein